MTMAVGRMLNTNKKNMTVIACDEAFCAIMVIDELGDNCIQNFCLGRYIIGYFG